MLFQDCTLYFPNSSRIAINRVPASSAEVYSGLRYGVYAKVTKVRFVASGQRGMRHHLCASYPFLVVLARCDSLVPDTLSNSANIQGCSKPSMESLLLRFIEKLRDTQVQPLFADLRIHPDLLKMASNGGSALPQAS